MADEKVVEVMARGAQRAVSWSCFWSDDDARELMRAALAALEKEGYVVAPFEAERMPLTQEQRDSVVGITDYMRGAALSDPPKE